MPRYVAEDTAPKPPTLDELAEQYPEATKELTGKRDRQAYGEIDSDSLKLDAIDRNSQSIIALRFNETRQMSSAALPDLLDLIHDAGPSGIGAVALHKACPEMSRSTLNRRLSDLVTAGGLVIRGAGPATRYVATSPFSRADIDAYFAVDWSARQVARFEEALLEPRPNIAPEVALRCTQIQALAMPLDQRMLTTFVVDFSWASSVLEGGTYSALDTQALIQYGQRNKDKPTADAVLVLNHKRAAEYLWTHRELTLENACRIHALLTDDHGIKELEGAEHFLPEPERGIPREYAEVNLALSAYLPPFRPRTGFIGQALQRILQTANELGPIEAALYLLSRLPYLQAFSNGNKRTARVLANAPLLRAGLAPFAFTDVDKADYIRGMAAFYELGNLLVLEQAFLRGYVRSVIRNSNVPVHLRAKGFDTGAVADDLLRFVQSGRVPSEGRSAIFLGPTRAPANTIAPESPTTRHRPKP